MQGKFVNEQELARDIGVSRTPVREALLLLVAGGLIELIPNRGALIPVISGRQIAELFELRGILERHAAASTIAAGTVPQAMMEQALKEQRELILQHDGTADNARGPTTGTAWSATSTRSSFKRFGRVMSKPQSLPSTTTSR
jgi:DNA-binding GntR family transcriptional regulator